MRRDASDPDALDTVLRDGEQIWRALKTEGGLDPRPTRDGLPGYDTALADELNARLFPGSPDSLERNLSAHATTSEAFVGAFFEALAPFVQMMEEVLRFFEQAGANRGERNLRIELDFRGCPKTCFDLEHFKTVVRRLEAIVQPVQRWDWGFHALWNLHGALADLPALHQHGHWSDSPDPRIRAMADASRDDPWTSLPAPDASGMPALDAALARLALLLEAFQDFCRAHAPSREAFGRYWSEHRRRISEEAAGGGPQASSAARLTDVYHAQTDYFAESTAAMACTLAALLRDTPPKDRAALAAEALDRVLPALDAIERTGIERIVRERLEELLNLPAWRRRHELYAVWVGARIAATLDGVERLVHVEEDGLLRFSFSGVHLATFWRPREAVLEFWTELRSRLAARSARSGRAAIQPDYRLVRTPRGDAVDTTLLVVECKQYRRSSTRNFGAAVNDYAQGCPNATVVLANYGPVAPAAHAAVEPALRPRVVLVGSLRPGNAQAEAAFRQAVRGAVLAQDPQRLAYRDDDDGQAWSDAATFIELQWSESHADLDLHLIVRMLGQTAPEHVYHRERGRLDAPPWLRLGPDRRAGPGYEAVRIARPLQAEYQVYVCNYSSPGAPPVDGVQVTVSTPLAVHRFDGAAEQPVGRGGYWHVATIDGASGTVHRVGGLVDALPDG